MKQEADIYGNKQGSGPAPLIPSLAPCVLTMQCFEEGQYIKKVTAELIRDTEETEPVRTAVPHSRGKQKNAIFSSKDKEEGEGCFLHMG